MNYIKKIGSNKVFEDMDCYYIQAPKKEVYISVDKDEQLINYLENCINTCGNLNYVSSCYPFEFQKGYKGKKLYISHLLYCYYNKLNLSKLNNLRVTFVDGNQFNCKSSNLINTKSKYKTKTKSITISHDSDYIYITYTKRNLKYVTNYEPELYKIITNSRLHWTVQNYNKSKSGSDDFRLKAELYYNNKKRRSSPKSISISRLVYGYYYHNIRLSNLFSSIIEMNRLLEKDNLFIDHLIGDEFNNTIANLSAIYRGLNTKKQIIDRKIIPPYYLIMAHKNGIYKAVYGFGCFVAPVMEFRSLETMLKSLKAIIESKPFSEYKSPSEWRTEGDIKRFNLTDSHKVQKVLYDNFDNPLADIRVGQYIATFY